MTFAGITLFTAINKHGQLSNHRISGEAVSQMLKARQVTGHKSDTTLNRYIRSTNLFTDAAAGRLL